MSTFNKVFILSLYGGAPKLILEGAWYVAWWEEMDIFVGIQQDEELQVSMRKVKSHSMILMPSKGKGSNLRQINVGLPSPRSRGPGSSIKKVRC